MAHHNLAFPGGVANGTVPTPSQINALDQGQYTAIDGDNGGVWAPIAPVVIGGQGFDFVGPLVAANATLTLTAPSTYVAPIIKSVNVPCRCVPAFFGSTGISPDSTTGNATNIRPVNAAYPPIPSFPGFITSYAFLAGPDYSGAYVVDGIDPYLIDGATLQQAALFGQMATHTNLPSRLPAFGIFRFRIASGNADLSAAFQVAGTLPLDNRLLSVFSQQMVCGSVGAYNAANEFIVFTPDQNAVIDKRNYSYAAVIWDEGGPNSVAGNAYTQILLQQSIPGQQA